MYSYITIPKHTAEFTTGCIFYVAYPNDQCSFGHQFRTLTLSKIAHQVQTETSDSG